MNQRPNILLFITDQQSATMLGCAGNPHVRTPAMDSIASGGVRFERAYCTDPVCCPSRISLLSGRMPGEFGGYRNESPWKVPDGWDPATTLGALAQSAGYETLYGGKIHTPKPLSPKNVGFEYFCEDEREALAHACAERLRTRADPRPFLMVASFINPHDICLQAITAFPNERVQFLIDLCKVEAETAREASRLPEGMDEDEFFATVCPPLPDNHAVQADEPEAYAKYLDIRGFQREARARWTDRDWRLHRWTYARLTERVDAHIGEVLAALDESGHRDDTLVLFTSDHGDHDASHKLEHKSILYEEAVRIPLLARYPGHIPAGRVDTAHLVSNGLDLIPTVCDYAGIPAPEGRLGRSLRPLLEGREPPDRRRELYIEGEVGFGIVTDRFKYVLNDGGREPNDEQLYDRVLDPGETRNHIADPANAVPLAEARARLAEYQNRLYGGNPPPTAPLP